MLKESDEVVNGNSGQVSRLGVFDDFQGESGGRRRWRGRLRAGVDACRRS